MKNIAPCATGFTAFLATLAIAGAAAADPAPVSSDILLSNVELRPGVAGDVHLHVTSSPNPHCQGRSILAVHGALSDAASWENFAQAAFAAPHGDNTVCRFVAIDLPGHGQSSVPAGILFGDITLHDYVSAVAAALDHLADQGLGVNTVMGHSQGGMVLQLLQQRLVDEGSSLRSAYDVRRATLLAAVPPRAIPWAFPTNPGAAVLGQFVSFDPALGVHVSVPSEVWRPLVFSTPTGALAANAPSVEEITARGYASPEPIATLAELLGTPPFARPDVAAGIFAPGLGTQLDVVSFENDAIIRPNESGPQYMYLTGQSTSHGFTVVHGADATHGLIISNPREILDALQGG
jgi:pimeloyl-ACP methyl ester carboxylesterase